MPSGDESFTTTDTIFIHSKQTFDMSSKKLVQSVFKPIALQ